MCRVKLYFRHNIDSEFFGKQVALAAHQGPRVKHVQKSPQQFTVGHELRELVDRGEGTSEMEGQTTTQGATDTLTDTLTTAVRNAEQQTKGQTGGRSTSRADACQRTSTKTTNITYKQTLVPKIVTKEIVSGLQFYGKDEIEWAAAAELKELGTGEAILLIDGHGVWKTQTPLAVDPLGHAPKFAAGKMRQWREEIVARDEFASPEAILQERKEFLDRLIEELRKRSFTGADRSAQERLITGQRPMLVEPVEQEPDKRLLTDKEDENVPWSI